MVFGGTRAEGEWRIERSALKVPGQIWEALNEPCVHCNLAGLMAARGRGQPEVGLGLWV